MSDLPYLFLIPGMGGHDPNLVEVADSCTGSVRTVLISYPRWTHLLAHPEYDLDALIGDVDEQIAAHSPTGPILLAGYSFGGIVAFALAARLRDAGRWVNFLGLLDIAAQPAIDPATGTPQRPMTRRQEMAGFIAALRRGEGASKLAYVVARRLVSPRWAPALRAYGRVPRRWVPGPFAVYLDRDLLFWQSRPLLREWAIRRDHLPPLDVPAFLFRTAQHANEAPAHLGWDGRCTNLTIISLPGTHLGLLGPTTMPALQAAFGQAASEVLGRRS